MSPRRVPLQPDDMPTHWDNIAADLRTWSASMRPGTPLPAGPDDREATVPMPIIEQAMATELEKALGKPARIDYKFAGTSHVGRQKLNSAIA